MSDKTISYASPAGTSDGHDEHHHHGTGVYWLIFILLMVLLLATVGAAYINLGHFNVPVAYAIASLKAVLILWFFMHLNQATRLVQVFAFASFAWLALFMIMIGGDYLSRNWQGLPRAQASTHIRKVDSYGSMSGIKHSEIKEGEEGTKPGGTKGSEGGPTEKPEHQH